MSTSYHNHQGNYFVHICVPHPSVGTPPMKQLCLSARVSDSQDDKQVINVLTRTDVKNTKKKSESRLNMRIYYGCRRIVCSYLVHLYLRSILCRHTHTHTRARARAQRTSRKKRAVRRSSGNERTQRRIRNDSITDIVTKLILSVSSGKFVVTGKQKREFI